MKFPFIFVFLLLAVTSGGFVSKAEKDINNDGSNQGSKEFHLRHILQVEEKCTKQESDLDECLRSRTEKLKNADTKDSNEVPDCHELVVSFRKCKYPDSPWELKHSGHKGKGARFGKFNLGGHKGPFPNMGKMFAQNGMNGMPSLKGNPTLQPQHPSGPCKEFLGPWRDCTTHASTPEIRKTECGEKKDAFFTCVKEQRNLNKSGPEETKSEGKTAEDSGEGKPEDEAGKSGDEGSKAKDANESTEGKSEDESKKPEGEDKPEDKKPEGGDKPEEKKPEGEDKPEDGKESA